MPRRKITLEMIEAEPDPSRKWVLAKSVWFRHAMRVVYLLQILDRLTNPTPENATVYVETRYAGDIGALKRDIAYHEGQRKIYGDLWELYSSDKRCVKCGQKDEGQTGEHPCDACGLPILHDILESETVA